MSVTSDAGLSAKTPAPPEDHICAQEVPLKNRVRWFRRFSDRRSTHKPSPESFRHILWYWMVCFLGYDLGNVRHKVHLIWMSERSLVVPSPACIETSNYYERKVAGEEGRSVPSCFHQDCQNGVYLGRRGNHSTHTLSTAQSSRWTYKIRARRQHTQN